MDLVCFLSAVSFKCHCKHIDITAKNPYTHHKKVGGKLNVEYIRCFKVGELDKQNRLMSMTYLLT